MSRQPFNTLLHPLPAGFSSELPASGRWEQTVTGKYLPSLTAPFQILVCCNFASLLLLSLSFCSRVPYPKVGLQWPYLTLLFSQGYQLNGRNQRIVVFWMRAGKYHFPFMTLWWHLFLHLLTVQMTTWCWYLKGFGFEASGNWQWTFCVSFLACATTNVSMRSDVSPFEHQP